MHFHKGKNVYFTLHPKTATRAMAPVLAARGFEQIGGHHSGPIYSHLPEKRKFPTDRALRHYHVWLDGTPEDKRHITVVRNHYDAIFTWLFYSKVNQHIGNRPNEWFVREWLWKKSHFWPHIGTFWKYGRCIKNTTVLKYENLREEFNAILIELGLEGLRENEMQVHPKHVTKDKPADGWKYWDPEPIAAVQEIFGEEMEYFGYSWESYVESFKRD